LKGGVINNRPVVSVIAAIVELNQLDSMTVQPGQRLAIPAEFSN
jgi:LysM repeat protein